MKEIKTSRKIKILIAIFVIVVISIISGWWVWTNQVPSEAREPIISTAKIEYKKGEQIKATLKFKGEIYRWDRYPWSIQKWDNDSWVSLQARDDLYFFCSNTPECKDVNLKEIKECPPTVLCERETWYKVENTPELTWDQFYKTGEKTFQCKAGKIERTEAWPCTVFDQAPSGKYKIRFEYTTSINPDNPFSREIDIKYAEKEIVIK